MENFVDEHSIVRKIWGSADTILFIFGGASAEFALNKAVDWLYYTGKLPIDPIGRLFSTVTYAREIIFSTNEHALAAIDKMRSIHTAVEKSRGYEIPDWAYRDVLFMLIYYSISAYEKLEQKLSPAQKAEVYEVFYKVGKRMNLKDLPLNYNDWVETREHHLEHHLQNSQYTKNLFKQYRKHLGWLRYFILIQAQKLVVPNQVKRLLGFNPFNILLPVIPIYKLFKKVGLDKPIKKLILPSLYKKEFAKLEVAH